MSIQGRDAPSLRIDRISGELERARERARSRSDLLRARTLLLSRPVADPAGSVAATRARTTIPAAELALRLRAFARPVATVLVTTTLVLSAWLLVLEPALGARPVLVMDDGMSPTLRIGDVAFAEDLSRPLSSGAIVAVRIDGAIDVSRLIAREPALAPASEDALVVRDDAEGLEVRRVVPADRLIGVIGAAVPRVGLPVVWLRAPATAPLGTAVVVLLIVVSALGVSDALRERAARRASGVSV
jgi:hypothetical protein